MNFLKKIKDLSQASTLNNSSVLENMDDIKKEIKQRRLEEIINLQQKHSKERNQRFLNLTCPVLIDKSSKKSDGFWSGRTSENNVVVFPKESYSLGDIVQVTIEDCTSATLIGTAKNKSLAI